MYCKSVHNHFFNSLFCANSQNRYTNMYVQNHKHHNEANHLENNTEKINGNSIKLSEDDRIKK